MPFDPTQRPADAARTLLGLLDLTSLGDADTAREVQALAGVAQAVVADGLPAPAALCVWPRFAVQARAAAPAGVRIAAVANFPHADASAAQLDRELRQMIAAGVDEIDVVLPWRAVAEGELAGPARVLDRVRRIAWDRTVKLIVESGDIGSRTALAAACRLGLDAGVDFLKTSTGKVATGATPEAARAMLQAIAAHPRGAQVGFKASGGVRSAEQAFGYAQLVREILGDEALRPERFRIGASALADDLRRVAAGGCVAP